MQSNGIIRKAQPEDFEAIYPLLEQLWLGQSLDKEKLSKVYQLAITNVNEYTICYLRNNEILGFAAGNIQNAFYRAGKLCYLAVLVIDSEHRGEGIGIKLMNYVKELAIQKQCNAIELESGFQREKAHQFYGKYGFQKTAYTFALELNQQIGDQDDK